MTRLSVDEIVEVYTAHQKEVDELWLGLLEGATLREAVEAWLSRSCRGKPETEGSGGDYEGLQ